MTSDVPGGSAPGDDDDLDASDEALNWDGERDASHVAGPAPLRAKPAKAARPVRPADASEADDAAAPPLPDTRLPSADTADAASDVPVPTSSFLLVSYGILAGVFFLYAVGWFTSVRRSTYVDPTALGTFMTGLGQILAVAVAPVWFGVVFALTRNSKPITRLLWLLLGLVLLVPVPFVMGV